MNIDVVFWKQIKSLLIKDNEAKIANSKKIVEGVSKVKSEKELRDDLFGFD